MEAPWHKGGWCEERVTPFDAANGESDWRQRSDWHEERWAGDDNWREERWLRSCWPREERWGGSSDENVFWRGRGQRWREEGCEKRRQEPEVGQAGSHRHMGASSSSRAPQACARAPSAPARMVPPASSPRSSAGVAHGRPTPKAALPLAVAPRGDAAMLLAGSLCCVDLVRALCFRRQRAFLLSLESELVRLLDAPRGAVLRLPRLAPKYDALLRAACERFQIQVEEASLSDENGVGLVATAESHVPLPIEALVPGTWEGVAPSSWLNTRPSSSVAVQPYLEVDMQPEHDFRLHGHGIIAGDSDLAPVAEPLPDGGPWLQLAGAWEIEGAWCLGDVSADGGGVLSFDLDPERLPFDHLGVALAISGGPSIGHGDEEAGELSHGVDTFMALFHPIAAERCWMVEFGSALQLAADGAETHQRVPWLPCAGGVEPQGSGALWVAVRAGTEGDTQVDMGVGRFPWGRITAARVPVGKPSACHAEIAMSRSRQESSSLLRSPALVEVGVCDDLASRDHVVHLSWPSTLWPAPKAPSHEAVVVLPRGRGRAVGICATPAAATVFQERAGKEGWVAWCLAGASLDNLPDQAERLDAVLQSRADLVAGSCWEAVNDLGLGWAFQHAADDRVEVPMG